MTPPSDGSSAAAATEPPPRENPALIGHARAERILLDCWNSGRLPHAWLIGGPPGIGKATLAFRFARFVLAQGDGPALLPPDQLAIEPESGTFSRVASGGHADLMTLQRVPDPKRGTLTAGIPVDLVRQALRFARLTPAEAAWRVIVVDTADDLAPAGANALLKVLEEPPANALFLLVSHAPGRLLPTIRSRCRRLDLAPLAVPDLAELLQRYRPALDPETAKVLAGLAEGSIGQAARLADEGGVALYGDVMRTIASLPNLDPKSLQQLSERLGGRGAAAEAAFRTFAGLLEWWFQRFLRALARGETPEGLVAEEEGLHARLSAQADLDRWLEVWEKVTGLLSKAGAPANLDRKQVVLGAFLAMEAGVRRP